MALRSVLINWTTSSKGEQKNFEGDQILKFYPSLWELKVSYM